MTDIDREKRIRIHAHEIWERGGRREGQEDENWDQARREIEVEDEDAVGLGEVVTEAIGLTVGQQPAGEEDVQSEHSQDPAEGSRATVEKQLSRKKKPAKS